MDKLLRKIVPLCLFLFAFTVTGCDDSDMPNVFTKEKMGAEWPFREIEKIKVECVDGMYVVGKANGETYALNGTAKTVADEKGWIKSEEIHIVGKDIGPMIRLGLEMCEKK